MPTNLNGMTSLTEVFRIGRGPSSSHSMGPEKAAQYMMREYPSADAFKVVLQGSLAKTGVGHRTDYALVQTFAPHPCEIVWDMEDKELPHPNTMILFAYEKGREIAKQTILSVGGGAIEIPGHSAARPPIVYKETTFEQIAKICKESGITLAEYVYFCEPGIKKHLEKVWDTMQETVSRGLIAEGELPGGLHLMRRAYKLYTLSRKERDAMKKQHFKISAYAYAASEENAAGGRMVTCPTCGACGVLPGVLFYEYSEFGCEDEQIHDALAVAGIIGQLIKTNASVSGAEAGCQAEVGSACSMAAAALCVLHGLSIDEIEAAAEMAMEHSLGLTCDPVDGLVQIPCIERNAVGALRAMDAATLAEVAYQDRKVSFDTVVKTMYETGKDLSRCYRETSEGGLAKLYVNKSV